MILDAMAVGLPVVATPAGQVEPLVRVGIVEPAPATPGELAAAILRVAGSEAHARRLQTAGHDFLGEAHPRGRGVTVGPDVLRQTCLIRRRR